MSPPLGRSRWVTVVGWIVAAASVIALPFSAISFIMVLVGSEGTAHMDPLRGLIVIAGPPATLLAGIGLVRRWRWAWVCLLLVLAGFAGWSIHQVIKGPSPARTYTSADGVLNTVSATEVNTPFHVVVIGVVVGLSVFLHSRNVRQEFRIYRRRLLTTGNAAGTGVETARPVSPVDRVLQSSTTRGSPGDDAADWRVGHQGRDSMYYEENHGGTWHRLEISGEMLTGRAHHVIYFASPQAWQGYPAWARHRRDEIIARITSQFRQPEYEYANDVLPAPRTDTDAAPVSPNESSPRVNPLGGNPHRVSRQVVSNSVGRKPSQALLLAIVGLLAVAVGMFWLVQRGIGKGETFFPSKGGSQRRTISHIEQPAQFWVSIGLYTTMGSGTLGLAVWGIRAALKRSNGGRS